MLDATRKSDIGFTLVFSARTKTPIRVVSVTLFSVWLTTAPAIFVTPAIAQNGDDYLKALNSEADNTSALSSQPNAQPTETPTPIEKNPLKDAFEKLLELELPATYKFYAKLNTKDQNKVVQTYAQAKKMSAASKLIFDLYFHSRANN